MKGFVTVRPKFRGKKDPVEKQFLWSSRVYFWITVMGLCSVLTLEGSFIVICLCLYDSRYR